MDGLAVYRNFLAVLYCFSLLSDNSIICLVKQTSKPVWAIKKIGYGLLQIHLSRL